MATIDTMTDSGQPQPAQPAAPQHPAPATPPPGPAAATADSAGTARQPRSLLIPLPTAITAALVAGLFGLLYLNLNSLSDDINGLRNEMNDFRSEVRTEINDLRNEINAVLLDHTDRLSRIETLLDLRPRTDATSP